MGIYGVNTDNGSSGDLYGALGASMEWEVAITHHGIDGVSLHELRAMAGAYGTGEATCFDAAFPSSGS